MVRETHLADTYHRSIGSNGVAISSNWRLSATGTGQVVWTPEGGGGAVSYGSNATDVSNYSHGGFSSLVTRADHYHRGVQSITANGSNAVVGTVNLVAGAGIALSVAGNNITISFTNQFPPPTSVGTMPTFVAAGTVGAGAGDITPGLPAGLAENDIMLLAVESDDAQLPATPSGGWAHVTGSPQTSSTGNGTGLSVFWKRATSSESAPTLTDPGDHMLGQILAFRGCPTTGDPWDTTSAGKEDTANTTLTATGSTTTVGNCLVVIFAGHGVDTATPDFAAWANSDLSSITSRINEATTAGHGGVLGAAQGGKAAAGAYGNTTATHGSAADCWLTVALKPA